MAKIFFKIIAWLGMCFFILLIAVLFWQSFAAITTEKPIGGLLFCPENAFMLSFIGLIPMLIGGLLGKPKYFWIICIITGSLYIISLFYFYTYLPERIHNGDIYIIFRELFFSVIPGLVAIIEGIWLKRLNKPAKGKELSDSATF